MGGISHRHARKGEAEIERERENHKDTAAHIKSSSMLCRMLCLLTCEKLFRLWINSQQPGTHDEQDRKAMGKNHLFYVQLAKAFVDKDWETAAGNSISVPPTHRFDSPPAPQDFIDLLAGLDLETCSG